jgi:hypothetical protein
MYFGVLEKAGSVYRVSETYSMVYGEKDSETKAVVGPTAVQTEKADPVEMPKPPVAMTPGGAPVELGGVASAPTDSASSAAVPSVASPANSIIAPKPTEKAQAENIFSGVKVSGFIDTYYIYDMALPVPATTGGLNVPGTTSTSAGSTPRGNVTYLPNIYHDQFTMNLAVVTVSKETEKYDALISFGLGPEASWFGGSGTSKDYNTTNLTEAYVTYKIYPKGPAIKIGLFDSLLGAESHYSVNNFNYTFSYGHIWATPTWHSGVVASYAFAEWLNVEAYFVDGCNTIYETNASKSIGGRIKSQITPQIEITLGGLSGNETAVGGADKKSSVEGIAIWKPIKDLSLMVDAIYSGEVISEGAARFVNSTAGYAQYRFTKEIALSGRYETYYDDALFSTGLRTATPSLAAPQILTAITGTLTFSPTENFLIKFEYRTDTSNSTVLPFVDSTGAAKDSQTLALTSASLKF